MIGKLKRRFYAVLAAAVAGFVLVKEDLAWVLVPAAILVAVVLVVAGWSHHRKYVPRNRVRSMRLRLHMRTRPGRGLATLFEVWLRWSRFAAWRKSRTIRPSLPSWHRLTHPYEHSELIGRVQYRHALRVPLEQHLLLLAPPRTGKSSLMSAMLLRFPGAAVVTSSRTDQYELSSGVRSSVGPIETFNPMRLGDVPSSIRFDPIQGCLDPQVAIRRADSFAAAVGMDDTENGGFFESKCSSYYRAMFAAAAIVGGDLRLVARWVFTSAEQAEHILSQAGHDDWAAELAELRGPASRQSASVKSVMSRALAFLNDPMLAEAVKPGGGFDIPEFLARRGTLYMIAPAQTDTSPMAALFAVLASEIHYEAVKLAAVTPGGRCDPPVAFMLDEVTQICPVPVSSWLADSGGRGIQITVVAHSWSQLAAKFGSDAATTIMETSGVKVLLPGITDADLLGKVSKVCGEFQQRLRDQDHHSLHPVLTEGMLRSLPDGTALVLSGNRSPVIGRMERGYKQRVYKRARRHGCAVAPLNPVLETPVSAELVAIGGEVV